MENLPKAAESRAVSTAAERSISPAQLVQSADRVQACCAQSCRVACSCQSSMLQIGEGSSWHPVVDSRERKPPLPTWRRQRTNRQQCVHNNDQWLVTDRLRVEVRDISVSTEYIGCMDALGKDFHCDVVWYQMDVEEDIVYSKQQ